MSAVDDTGPPLTARPAGEGLFVRNATGLVRGVSPLTSIVVNYIPGAPVLGLAFGLFFAMSLYPGGNFFLALLLLLPMTLAFAYSFGMLTTAIPRSGGDYTLVSRVVHPVAGVVSSFFMLLANGMFSAAGAAWFFTMLGLAPGLKVIGLVGHWPTVVSWGDTLQTSKNWQFGIGLIVLVVGAIPLLVGWRWATRVQFGLFIFSMLGLIMSAIIALITSKTEFAKDFNKFAQPYTHKPDTYASIIAKAQHAGVNVAPAFSFRQTLPVIAVVSTFGIFAYFTAFIGGEIRQGRSIKTAHRMAIGGFTSMASLAIFVLIFFHSFGTKFLTAAYGPGMPQSISAPPTYFFLTSAQLRSVTAAIFLVASFTVFWILITYIIYLQPTRMFFAYAFDGLLPKGVAKVSKRNVPVVAITLELVLAALVLAWALYLAKNVFQVLTYTVLVQLAAMTLVGLAAVVFPYRRRQFFQASASTRRLFGIPLVSVAGAAAIVSAAILWILYFTEANLGLTDKGNFALWICGTAAAAVLLYAIAWFVRRREGTNLNQVYAEIPPE